MGLHNPWTGKPLDSVRDVFPRASGVACDECGCEMICNCMICGAPNCCPRCCEEANREEPRNAD